MLDWKLVIMKGIELEILKNNTIFGINSDNKRVEEIFNEKSSQIGNKENRIKYF